MMSPLADICHSRQWQLRSLLSAEAFVKSMECKYNIPSIAASDKRQATGDKNIPKTMTQEDASQGKVDVDGLPRWIAQEHFEL